MAFARALPKIKFCGLTRHADVDDAIECGADAIGLNFYKPSPRYLVPELARELSARAEGAALRVGVFVNATPQEIAQVVAICPLDAIQLHGDETPTWLASAQALPPLQSLPIIKAIAWRGLDADRSSVEQWVDAAEAYPHLIGLLVDAYDPIHRGGTGKTARWDTLFPKPVEFGNLPFLLAGGLTPSNLESALQVARPNGIDVASGIESAPGVKDLAKMQAIGDRARRYFAATQDSF